MQSTMHCCIKFFAVTKMPHPGDQKHCWHSKLYTNVACNGSDQSACLPGSKQCTALRCLFTSQHVPATVGRWDRFKWKTLIFGSFAREIENTLLYSRTKAMKVKSQSQKWLFNIMKIKFSRWQSHFSVKYTIFYPVGS